MGLDNRVFRRGKVWPGVRGGAEATGKAGPRAVRAAKRL